MKLRHMVLVVFPYLILISIGCGEPERWNSLSDYYSSIDRSCEHDSDCKIKNIGMCCGYNPSCVNENADADPKFVSRYCFEHGIISICGFCMPDRCKCEENQCMGVQSEDSN